MIEKSLKQIIESGESQTVEFKRTFDTAAIETISAFANTVGGVVIVGVSDDGEISGIEIGKETLKDWQNNIKTATAPSLLPDITEFNIEGKTVVVISAQEMPVKPVACRGRYFRRSLNANNQLSIAEMMDLHLRSLNTSWDFQPDSRHVIDDISLEKVSQYISLANQQRDSKITDAPLEVLRKFELLRNDVITYGCYLLFMKSESLLTTVEMGRFQTDTIIKDGTRTRTDLFSEVDIIMGFIRKHINKRIVISGKPQHDEIWDYPPEALREAVINAIIHRDYRSSSDSVIKIFDDRIEIYNPGKLPEGVTVAKLLAGDYVSTPRNKQIAAAFKEAGIIEKYGSGIRRIRTAMVAAGNPEPLFEEIGEGFRVTLKISLESSPLVTPL
ncbi:MAG: putative DNA binding domain-containing protein, partial [Chitinispirillaceae bacterium]|nr:putative DNA binding domain-containing protein [Chitinispirillaceae bacterium]